VDPRKNGKSTNYLSKRVFFSSEVKTWCIGTSVWCVMFTNRSASENSSSRNWLDIATMTCFGAVSKIVQEGEQHKQRTLRAEGVIFPGKIMIPRFMLFSSKMLRSLQVGCMREFGDSLNLMGVCLLPHGLHSDTPFVGKKDENLVGWVFVGRGKEVELIPAADQGRMGQLVPATTSERDPDVLDGTHLIRVQLPKLCEVHLDFLV